LYISSSQRVFATKSLCSEKGVVALEHIFCG
jgi:hypothetical protein